MRARRQREADSRAEEGRCAGRGEKGCESAGGEIAGELGVLRAAQIVGEKTRQADFIKSPHIGGEESEQQDEETKEDRLLELHAPADCKAEFLERDGYLSPE